MKTWKMVLIGVVAVFVIAAGVIAYFVNSVISGGAKDRLLAAATNKLGTKVDLQSYGLDFGSLIRLKPAIKLSGLVVANPKGYSQRNMIEAETVDANLDLSAVMQKRIVVTSLDILAPKILIETGSDGKNNLEALLSGLKSGSPPQASAAPTADSGTDVSIAQIGVKNGLLSIASAAKPEPQVAFRDLNMTLANLAPNQACDIDLKSQLFETGSSQLTLAGKAGPFGGSALPIDAKATLGLPLAEIPPKARQEHFGELAADPGKDSRIDADLALRGDLYQTAEGPGQLKITSYLIGPANQQGRLALSGTAPINLKAVDLISGNDIEVLSKEATFNIGSGRWNGNLLLKRNAGKLNGTIDGGIQNVDVNQMLTSFAATPNKVYGTLAIPQFGLRFNGATPDEIQRSLAGQGRLTIANGKFQGLSVLSSIERALGGGQSGQDGAFAQFATSFGIQKQVIALNGIAAHGPGIDIDGQGSITFSKAINFNLKSKLTGATADRIRGLSRGFMSGDLVVPVQIAGTFDNPQVRPEMKGLMKSAATGAVQGILENFLGRKKK